MANGCVRVAVGLPAFYTRPCKIVQAQSESFNMRKFIVYRDHGHNAVIESDEDPIENTLGFEFKRDGKTVAVFRWTHIHGWEENLTTPRAKKTTAKS